MELLKTIDLACLQRHAVIENNGLQILIDLQQFTYYLYNDCLTFQNFSELQSYLSGLSGYDPQCWYVSRPKDGQHLVGCPPEKGQAFIEPPEYITRKSLQAINDIYMSRQIFLAIVQRLLSLASSECAAYYDEASTEEHLKEAQRLYLQLAGLPEELVGRRADEEQAIL